MIQDHYNGSFKTQELITVILTAKNGQIKNPNTTYYAYYAFFQVS